MATPAAMSLGTEAVTSVDAIVCLFGQQPKQQSDLESKSLETAILQAASQLRQNADEYARLVLLLLEEEKNPLSKAKTAKLIRQLLEAFDMPSALELEIVTCKRVIQWATDRKRQVLRKSCESCLIGRYLAARKFSDALSLIAVLQDELKRLDDRASLIEVQLLESRTWVKLRNFAKARAALTSARASANSAYCPPLLQAALDVQSGILHAQDRDYKTAYSYFYEAYDVYATLAASDSSIDALVLRSLRYVLLCKVMLDHTEDVFSLLGGVSARPSHRRFAAASELQALRDFAEAYRSKCLSRFNSAFQMHREDLFADPVINEHLRSLYERLLEANLLRILEPYSVVDLEHVVRSLGIDSMLVEQKISQMILDGTLSAVIDQESGCIQMVSTEKKNEIYSDALETIQALDATVDLLFEKAAIISV